MPLLRLHTPLGHDVLLPDTVCIDKALGPLAEHAGFRIELTAKRMQFVYRDGKLEENKGRWRGPVKPERYIEPLGTAPCFNVNRVEDCREELEPRRRRSKLNRNAKPGHP